MADLGITEFLLARIAEDEAAFSLPEWEPDCGGDWTLSGPGFFANYWPDNTVSVSIYVGDTRVAESGIVSRGSRAECQAFAERWIRDHSRALAECRARRRIVEELRDFVTEFPESPEFADGYYAGLDRAVHLLAAAYIDHPDYREEWRP